MDTGDGTYQDAQAFCATKGDGLHPVVIDSQERSVYQSSIGGGLNQYSGGFGGTSAAAGSVTLRFRCAQ